jgi:hypothetical protein
MVLSKRLEPLGVFLTSVWYSRAPSRDVRRKNAKWEYNMRLKARII